MSEQHFCQSPVDPLTWDLYRPRRACGLPASHHCVGRIDVLDHDFDDWYCDAHWELFAAEASNFHAQRSGRAN